MYNIKIYENKHKSSDLCTLLKDLSCRKGKDARINLNKINDYISLLSEHGLKMNYPYIKQIDKDIWELRPNRYRILFFMYQDSFILLHWFYKKTNKTPRHEIDMAIKEMNSYIEEVKNYE